MGAVSQIPVLKKVLISLTNLGSLSGAGGEGHQGRGDPQVDVDHMRRYTNTWTLG